MKINHHKSHAKLIIVIIVLFVLASGAMFFYLHVNNWSFFNHDQTKQTTDTDDQTKTDGNSSSTDKSDADSTDEGDTDSVDSHTPTQLEDPVDQNAPTLGVILNGADIIDGKAQIFVTIVQLIGSGTCTLTIGNYTTTAPVIANPQSSSCEGFSVPLSQIGSARDFTLKVVSGDRSGTVTGTIK